MAQQLTLDLDNNQPDENFMLWYEDTKAEPEQAIKNAGRYYYQKYKARPGRIVLPENWKQDSIKLEKKVIETLEKSLGLTISTSPLILTKHVAVYKE